VVAMGRPEEVAAVEGSHTGRWLRTVLPADGTRPADRPEPRGAGGRPRRGPEGSEARARVS
jgi:hypothetical protein